MVGMIAANCKQMLSGLIKVIVMDSLLSFFFVMHYPKTSRPQQRVPSRCAPGSEELTERLLLMVIELAQRPYSIE